MPKSSGSKQTTSESATDNALFADQMETLSPVEEMEIIERMAEAMPIHAFPPVCLRKPGELKELNIADWKKRTGYKSP